VNPRVTIALAVVVALVGGYIVAVDRPQAQRAEEARHLVHFAKDAITHVAVRTSKGTVELARTDATHWAVTAPFAAPASAFAVSDLLDAVLGIVPQRTVADTTTDWAAYGLTSPAAEITLTTRDGKTESVAIGAASPVSAGIYARTTPGTAVYLVDPSAKNALGKTAADLRQKTLADFSSADVQHVRVVSASETLDIQRLGSDRWRLAPPGRGGAAGAHPWPADDFKVTDLFFPITTSDAKAFHDGVRDPAAYGLDHPAVTVEITLQKRDLPLRFFFAPKGKVTYAMVAGASTVLEFDGGLVGRLTPAPISLVTKRLLPYNAQNLTTVTWSRGEQVLQVRRQGPGFSGGGMSDSQISDMFSSINLLEADAVEPASGPAPAGAPAFAIQTDGGEGAQFRVQVYRRPGGGWLATDQALGLRYRLAANVFDSFPKPVTAFLGIVKAAPAKPAAPHGGTPVTPTGSRGVTPTSPVTPTPPAVSPAPAKPATPTTP
jgi:hypothetical protein